MHDASDRVQTTTFKSKRAEVVYTKAVCDTCGSCAEYAISLRGYEASRVIACRQPCGERVRRATLQQQAARARYGSEGMQVATVALSEAPERPASAPPAAADAQGSPEPGQLSEAPSLPPEPPLLTAHGCGFGTGGRVDELEARWSAMLCARELPLEPASRDPSFEPDVLVTAEEDAALPL